jgi:hypothetical protein
MYLIYNNKIENSGEKSVSRRGPIEELHAGICSSNDDVNSLYFFYGNHSKSGKNYSHLLFCIVMSIWRQIFPSRAPHIGLLFYKDARLNYISGAFMLGGALPGFMEWYILCPSLWWRT